MEGSGFAHTHTLSMVPDQWAFVLRPGSELRVLCKDGKATPALKITADRQAGSRRPWPGRPHWLLSAKWEGLELDSPISSPSFATYE